MKNYLLIIFLSISALGFCQNKFNQFYSIDNILSKELIKSVAKDNNGYLWIATDDGVLRYDGYQTQLFFRQLPSPFTKAFLNRKNGQFYVVSDFGVAEIKDHNDSVHFKPFIIGEKSYTEQLNYPKSAYEDIYGNVWVGEMSSLSRYSERGKKVYDLGENFRSINYHRTFSFTEDAFGNLWIAPFKGPLLFYNRERDEMELIPINVPLTDVCTITTVRGDYLLIGGKEGLVKLKIDSDHNILETEYLDIVKNISTVKCIDNHHVYAGTWADGLHYLDLDSTTPFTKVSAIEINDIVDLYYDQSNDELWIAGSENIGILKSSIVSTVHAVGQNRIESVAFDDRKGIYYSIGEQIYYLKNINEQRISPLLASKETYFERLVYEENRLWIGDAFGAISYYDFQTKIQHILNEGTVNFSIQYLIKDGNENKWLAGNPRGLIRVDKKDSLHFYNALNQTVLARESYSNEIFCGSNGKKSLLAIYDTVKDSFNFLDLEYKFDCPESLVLNDFQFDEKDAIWLATDEGLLKIEKKNGEYKEVQKVIIKGLNPSEPVRALAFMDDYLCFANTQGLVIYKDDEHILFTQDSGLPSKILQERGLVLDKAGNLVIATAKGLALISKEAIQFKRTSTPHVEMLSINGKSILAENPQLLTGPYKSKVEVEFISLSYPANNIMYQTRIVGIDSEWSVPSTNRNLNVVGFSEGNYGIEIRAREDGKLWSEPLHLNLVILKPWYRTWWAMLIFIGSGLATILLATKIHNKNLIRQKKNLQKTIEARTQQVNEQNSEIIEQQKKLIQQKEELIAKNEAVYKSQQALVEADMNYMQLKEKQLQDEIEYKNKQITTHALNILQKNETLKHLRDQLDHMVKNNHKVSIPEIKKTMKTIDDSFRLDKDWEDFKFYFEQIHTGFYSKLNVNYPELTPLELRHCALIRLNLNLMECASILGISNDSIKVSRTRLRKKLGLTPNQSLTEFIMGI